VSEPQHIEVEYLARVEGEAGFRIVLDSQPDIELRIFEPPRFFEGFLVGRKYHEVGDIVSRICGICPVSHMTTAIQAIEKAMGIGVSEQTVLLRKIFSLSQIAASHLIHLYMLAMPDYYGFPGVVQMIPGHMPRLERLIRMKEAMNGLTALIGGRALHPVTNVPGGFTSIPRPEDFASVLKEIKAIRKDAEQAVRDIAALEVPDFHSDSVYVALYDETEYATNQGRIVSTSGLDISVDQYPDFFVESQVHYAYAKQTVLEGGTPIMVGALARLNIKFDKLQQKTRDLAADVGFAVPDCNPFHNNLAQALEVFDAIERCIQLIESHAFRDEEFKVEIRGGEGGSATEAPRGLLYHWYCIDRRGVVEKANLVTPTSHNFLNIEKDLKQLVAENRKQDREAIRLLCEKTVRAYDPCFSCSVH